MERYLMSLESNLTWAKMHLPLAAITGKSVLDVGSRNWDKTLAEYLHQGKPGEYIGIDAIEGPGVTRVCDANDLVKKFGKNRFDIVVCLEVLEHVANWVGTIENIKNVCAEDGIILMTTRIFGYPKHGFPDDYWRFEFEDIMRIFSDCKFLALEQDHENLGVYAKFQKPKKFQLVETGHIRLHSMKKNRRAFLEEGWKSAS